MSTWYLSLPHETMSGTRVIDPTWKCTQAYAQLAITRTSRRPDFLSGIPIADHHPSLNYQHITIARRVSKLDTDLVNATVPNPMITKDAHWWTS